MDFDIWYHINQQDILATSPMCDTGINISDCLYINGAVPIKKLAFNMYDIFRQNLLTHLSINVPYSSFVLI